MSRTTKAIPKSTSPETTAAAGTMRRGKYTFVMRLEFPTMLCEESVTPFAKKVQGTSAAKLKIG